MSKLFDEPKNRMNFFEVKQIRSFTITSPQFIYEVCNAEESLKGLSKEINIFMHFIFRKLKIEDECYVQMLFYLLKILVLLIE